MKDAYYQYLQSLKTYLKHHGRGVTFAQDFPAMELPPEQFPDPPSPDALPPSEPVDVAKISHDSPNAASNDPTHPQIRDLPLEGLTMADLEAFWSQCMRCKLGKTRNKLVFGEGAVPAKIFFIGEGPGANEDRQGRPFVGKAGQLLDKMITAMGLSRDQVYIGNIVKCRPPGNRDPEMDEMLACMPVLNKQIALIQPPVIVTLGRIAAQALLSTSLSLGRLRGRWHTYEGIKLLPTYHPAYLLRNPVAKKKAWDDLQLVMRELGLTGAK